MANNYPFVINFDELQDRIYKFKDDLVKIINGTAYSYYRDLAKQVYQMLINRFQIFRVSYFALSLFFLINILTSYYKISQDIME